MNKILIVVFALSIIFTACTRADPNSNEKRNNTKANIENYEIATLAGGCFWCIEAPFEKIDGVYKVLSGYAGGTTVNPSYQEVSSGKTDYREAVKVYFNPEVISYAEILDVFWKQFDPTDAEGSFYDRGHQYTSAIYYNNAYQKKLAKESKDKLDKSGVFEKQIITPIKKLTTFYPAEEYHQDFYKKDPDRYNSYRKESGRDQFILKHWREMSLYEKPQTEEIRKSLTNLQYKVTQKSGTEKAFENEYWDNKKKGIYVDIVTGEPLFSSADKFSSGTGWPSFTKPIDSRFIVKRQDHSFGIKRVEAKSKIGNSHLGHVFNDGPNKTKLRYCVNSASLKFIPKSKMKKEGYGAYLWLVN